MLDHRKMAVGSCRIEEVGIGAEAEADFGRRDHGFAAAGVGVGHSWV